MTLPTAAEINVYDSLDERVAARNFLGKSLNEAEGLFRENALKYSEDLMWMGPIAFRFYVAAYIRYIESDAALGAADAINCLVGFLKFRLETDAEEMTSVASQLAAICEYVCQNYDKFKLIPDIYGDLRPQLESLRESFLQML